MGCENAKQLRDINSTTEYNVDYQNEGSTLMTNRQTTKSSFYKTKGFDLKGPNMKIKYDLKAFGDENDEMPSGDHLVLDENDLIEPDSSDLVANESGQADLLSRMNRNLIFTAQSLIRVSCDSFSRDYKVIKKIGSGGGGFVFETLHVPSGQHRAVKIARLSNSPTHSKRAQMRLLDEADIITALDHPNIGKMYEVMREKDNYIVSMELCSGGSLFDNYKRPEFRNDRILASVMKQILYAVTYLHSKKVVHKDIKLENLLLQNDSIQNPVVKLIDFGLSEVRKQDVCLSDTSGTVFYMAPEVSSRVYTEKADLWSVGVILFILLTKRIPFNGTTREAVIQSTLTKELDFTTEEFKSLNPLAVDLLKRLLNRNPDERISAKEALQHEFIQNHFDKKPIDLTLLPEVEKIRELPKLNCLFMSLLLYQLKLEKEKEPYRNLFSQLDAEAKGYIDSGDLYSAYLRKYRNATAALANSKKFMALFDFDNSGRIELVEFLVACFAESLIGNMPVEKLFKMLDKNGNEFVEVKELEQTFRNAKGIDRFDWEKFVMMYDTDRDGKLSLAEFHKVFETK
mmetsp:Transcript_83350/g.97433  ORF Transcript_83350/g.97433 Transcript_83350/m.97433 type:complete len:570 (-) Transcript_83350:89-1798(-)